MLDFTLERLRDLEAYQVPFEVVVCDNCSTDGTRDVVAKHERVMPYLRYCRQERQALPFVGISSAIRNATGQCAIFMADDDSLIPDALFDYARRMERESDISAIVTDFVAWDDDAGRELHRYMQIPRTTYFGPKDSTIDLLNFVFQHMIYPEIVMYRREAFLRCDCLIKRGFLPFLSWMYRLSRLGRVGFDPEPFYREHRTVKKWLRRGGTTNMDLRFQYIGDEFRNVIETFVLWCLQDAGQAQAPPDQALAIRQMIDKFLHGRLHLEIQRAISESNWMLAAGFKRRLTLFFGPGNAHEQQQDARNIALPAALQEVHEHYCNLGDVGGLVLQGFKSPQVPGFFATHFPDMRVLGETVPACFPPFKRPLVLYKNDPGMNHESAEGPLAGYRLFLDQLLENNRVNALRIDLAEL